MNYYNEIDPYPAQWLRNLINAGYIGTGEVDERSIVDVAADDLIGFTQCHFFAGIGGWPLALRLAGWPDMRPVWTGSCPCQPFSVAGRQAGFDDDRHLWPHLRRLIEKRHPPAFLGEQVASSSDWLRLVRSDLEAMVYAVGAIPVEAASAGAYHKRDRYWIVADADESGETEGWEQRSGELGWTCSDTKPCHRDVGHSNNERSNGWETISQQAGRGEPAVSGVGHRANTYQSGSQRRTILPERAGEQPLGAASLEWAIGSDEKARVFESGIRLLAHGVPDRTSKLRAYGNAIDLRPAKEVIAAFMECRP